MDQDYTKGSYIPPNRRRNPKLQSPRFVVRDPRPPPLMQGSGSGGFARRREQLENSDQSQTSSHFRSVDGNRGREPRGRGQPQFKSDNNHGSHSRGNRRGTTNSKAGMSSYEK